MAKKISNIAVITSGGDAPGMNAAIRSVVMTAKRFNLNVLGFHRGYNGIIYDKVESLCEPQVRNIINQGGTILKSARCLEFQSKEGAQQAANNLQKHDIDCLIVIGGNGSFAGCIHLSSFWDGQIIALPGTIDNDIDGTDYTIGYATAVNTAIEAIDKIRDTADAFERVFLVEVMGRNSGYIAMDVAISTAAEQLITMEEPLPHDELFSKIVQNVKNAQSQRGDSSYLMVISENYWPGGSIKLAEDLQHQAEIDCQLCVLGYIQRGGRPVAQDRILATKLGIAATIAALNGESMIMVGEQDNKITKVPLAETLQNKKKLDHYLFNAQRQLLEFDY